MAYTRTTLISRPVRGNLGISEELGDFWDSIKSGASSALDFFGAGIKAQGAAEALQAQATAQAQAAAAAQAARSGGSGISTTTMLIGGVALAGVLVFALRRK